MEMKTQDFYPLFSSGDHIRKILIENDRENGCGKGGIGEIIHRPAKDLSLGSRHFRIRDESMKLKEGAAKAQNSKSKDRSTKK